MQAVTLSVKDLEIPFGKHKGTKLKDLPKDYLFYMFTEFDTGNHWKTYAKEELERRQTIEEHGGNTPDCTYEAAEELSKTILLREFIQRPDQSVGIYAWCAIFSKEVRRYGSQKSGICWHYLGHGFGYERVENKNVLRSVWKVPDGE